MVNTIEACKRTRAKLIFFDNVYMYGEVHVPMTEQTPYAPCSKKGAVRAEIATALMDEIKAGNLTAMIARSADFYGPNTKNGVPERPRLRNARERSHGLVARERHGTALTHIYP